MSNVVEVNFGAKRRAQRFDKHAFLNARGADVWVSNATGTFDGWFSSAPDALAQRVSVMFEGIDATFGEGASQSIVLATYDDKSCSVIDVEMNSAFLACVGVDVPEGEHQVNTENEAFFVIVTHGDMVPPLVGELV